MNKKIQIIISYMAIVLGAILASFSVACILLPNDAIDYGTAGIAIIISKLTGYNLSLCVLLVFLPFLIAGIFFLGKKFFVRVFIGFVVYTIGLAYFEKIPFELNTEHFLAVAFGGEILGIGLSLILRNVVVTFPCHESDQRVLTKGKFTVCCRRTICDNLSCLYVLTLEYDRFLVVTVALVTS